jgi:hypothetical protein
MEVRGALLVPVDPAVFGDLDGTRADDPGETYEDGEADMSFTTPDAWFVARATDQLGGHLSRECGFSANRRSLNTRFAYVENILGQRGSGSRGDSDARIQIMENVDALAKPQCHTEDEGSVVVLPEARACQRESVSAPSHNVRCVRTTDTRSDAACLERV